MYIFLYNLVKRLMNTNWTTEITKSFTFSSYVIGGNLGKIQKALEISKNV